MGLQAIEYHDLRFTKTPITRYSTCGVPYRAWLDVGVPKIPEELLDAVFYLYRTKADAEANENTGGTGFIVGLPASVAGHTHIYGVSNWHVAIKHGYSVIRLNRRDGGTDIIDFDPSQWVKHPCGYDIAACSLSVDLDRHQITAIIPQAFSTRAMIETWGVGPGENVFMVGRFIDHDGGPANNPSLRFGHISAMPSPIEQPTGVMGESYCIDLHSRTGFSGSPVFVYRTPGTNFVNDKIDIHERFMYLLGIHWGQFAEYWEVTTKTDMKKAADAGLITEGQYIKGMSGMTCVCPAWQIMELLHVEVFVEERATDDQELVNREIENGPNAVGE